MTENEAKKKWCPMTRFHVVRDDEDADRDHRISNKPSTDGSYVPDLDVYCIGSSCMMWRWVDSHPSAVKADMRFGYCGLAGKALG